MPPLGAAIVIYRRRGLSPERWSLPLDEPAVLSGAFVLDTGRGRRETLTFGPADRCRYQFADQRLTLTSGTVTRRFLAQLWFTPEGWRLRLERADDDRPGRPRSGRPLAHLPRRRRVPPAARPPAGQRSGRSVPVTPSMTSRCGCSYSRTARDAMW